MFSRDNPEGSQSYKVLAALICVIKLTNGTRATLEQLYALKPEYRRQN